MHFRASSTLRLTRVAVALAVLLVPGVVQAGTDWGGYRPHYQGYGVNTRGGRGGTVHRVTHLKDAKNSRSPDWEGSFRKAVTASGPRFVIFEVSGTIRLVSRIAITSPYLTIAGQTAPSPGITLRDADIQIEAHDIVIQHIRVRVGDVPTQTTPNGVWIRSDGNNIVLDHVSISWTVHNSFNVFAPNGVTGNGDVTLIDSIVSEALACSVHRSEPCLGPKGFPHSRAMLVGDLNTNTKYNNGTPRVAFVRNLSAHNRDRHPAIQGEVDTFIVNNLIYNPSAAAFGAIYITGGTYGEGGSRNVIAGNVMIPGPTTPGHNGYKDYWQPDKGDVFMVRVGSSTFKGTKTYLFGNYYQKHCGASCLTDSKSQWSLANDMVIHKGINVRVYSPPLTLGNLPLSSVMPYTKVEDFVLANAGARPLDRDSVDARIVQNVKSRSGRSINSQNEVGGWPVLAQNRRVLDVPLNPNAVVDGAGRTRIEAWLESFARALEPGDPGLVTLDPPSNLRLVGN